MLQFIFLSGNNELMQPAQVIIWDLLVDLQTRRESLTPIYTKQTRQTLLC